jgi:hypothetical protein
LKPYITARKWVDIFLSIAALGAVCAGIPTLAVYGITWAFVAAGGAP